MSLIQGTAGNLANDIIGETHASRFAACSSCVPFVVKFIFILRFDTLASTIQGKRQKGPWTHSFGSTHGQYHNRSKLLLATLETEAEREREREREYLQYFKRLTNLLWVSQEKNTNRQDRKKKRSEHHG